MIDCFVSTGRSKNAALARKYEADYGLSFDPESEITVTSVAWF